MDAKKKIKGKYNEDLTELPLLTDLNTTDPAKLLKHCDVCNQPTEKVVGSEYTKYRKLAKKATEDEEDTWETDYAYDYAKAKIVPDLGKHAICERVRKLETANVLVVDRMGGLARELGELRYRPLVARVKNRIGALLHGIAEGLQR